MVNFVWILSSDSVKSIPVGVSPEYLLPRGHAAPLVTLLPGSRVFIVERQAVDRVVAVVTVASVHTITAGVNSGDYIFGTDEFFSFNVSSSYSSGTHYGVNETRSLAFGLHPLDSEIANTILKEIISSAAIKFSEPGPNFFEGIEISAGSLRSPKSLARQAITKIIRRYSLHEIWSRQGDFLGCPFAEFAFQLLRRQKFNFDVTEVKRELVILDPLRGISQARVPTQNPANSSIRRFDLDFQPIDPAKIAARTFTQATDPSVGALLALIKTERAEKRHQEILREICIYLQRNSIVPYESNSVDLMFEVDGEVRVVEIKSANDDNFFSQIASGALQLALYANSLEGEFNKIAVTLAIERIGNTAKMFQMLRALDHLRVPYFLVDADKDLAFRYDGFLN